MFDLGDRPSCRSAEPRAFHNLQKIRRTAAVGEKPTKTNNQGYEGIILITQITGRLVTVKDVYVTLAVDAFHYEILIPEFTRRQLQSRTGEEVSLHTMQYLEGNPAQGRLTPRLVGFLNPMEREFFVMFCSVDGVGAKKALRAMVRPVQEVAASIEQQDVTLLSSLPGIGPATAERIVAKLRRRVPKFALLVAQDSPERGEIAHDIVAEAFDVLRTLGHSESDARRLLDSALSEAKPHRDVESLLRAVYDHSHSA